MIAEVLMKVDDGFIEGEKAKVEGSKKSTNSTPVTSSSRSPRCGSQQAVAVQ